MPVFKGINFIWAGLSFLKCATCGNFGHVFSGCSSSEKTFGLGFKKRFLCSNLDKKCLVLIYAKKQAPVSCFVSFGGATWASVVSGSPKNLSSTLFVETNMNIELVGDPKLTTVTTSEVAILASCVSVLKHLFENVSDQVADISHKLDRLLAVSLASFVVLPTLEHNPMLNMAVDTLLFVPPMPSVIAAVAQDIFPSGFRVLTAKVGGLKTSLLVLENSIKIIMNKLNSFGSGSSEDIIRWHTVLNNNISIVTETKFHSSVKSWITNKFSGVRVFTSGLDAGFLGAGVALIMNENLARHVLKISEILGRLLMVRLLFKNKQCVSVLGLYVEASQNRRTIQADLINSFIARACNKSTFIILGVNALVNCLYIKAFTWSNFRGIEKTIDFVFISQSLIVDVNEFFNTDHSSVQITIGLGRILDLVLRAIHVQANRNKLELLVSKLVKASYSVLSDEFVSLLDIWISLDFVNASVVKFLFLLESHFNAIRIMEGWTKKCIVIGDISDDWSHQFQLLEYVFDDAFSNIMHPIEVDEFFGVVLDLPDNKAAGLSGMTIQSPIFAIGSVIENALEKNCKLWLVLQDIRKAYDSVKRQEAVCGYRLNSHYVAKTGHVNLQNGFISFFAAGAFATTQHILNIASEFFRLSDILINNDKTVMIPINCRMVVPFLSISDAPISIAKKEVSHCYLGVFLSSDELSKPSLAKAHSNVWFFANLVLKKAISNKQFSYLVLAVLYFIIGYKTQFSFVSASVYQKWDVLIQKGLKLKSGLSLDFLNNAEGKVAAMVCFANSVSSWHPVYPLCFPVHISVNPLNNFLAGVVRVFLDSGLFLGNLVCDVFCFQNRTSLFEILSESMYFRCLPSLCHYEIAFKRLNLHGPVPVWFAIAVYHLYVAGSFNIGSSPLVVTSVKNILDSHKFRSVHDWLSGLGAFNFSVYTDGFLCGLRSMNMKAGAAVFFEDINLGLGVEVFGIISSTLVELQAIVLALECVPSSSSVYLFSDSQAALNACNNRANLLASVSSHLGQLLHSWFKKCFILANGNTISGNSRHFVGSDAKIVNSCILSDIDWCKLFLVWHPDSHMAAGFTSYHSAGFLCLYCGNVELSDHVFSCMFDAAAWFQLFVDFASTWKTVSGLSYASFHVSQMLSNCLADLKLVVLLCKSFVLMDWCQEATSCFNNSKVVSGKVVEFVRSLCLSFRNDIWLVRSKHCVYMKKHGLIPYNSSILVLVSGGMSVFSA
ncbi:hypothetical protein G9A89_021009 [Geosiphon pyriformis]|nr:hypothetical protein G9A89_021009 [Geosiphon pyriformis]